MVFPAPYYELIRETFFRTNKYDLPTLYLSVSFSDIQGKTYNKNIQLNVDTYFSTQYPDGSGFCILNLMAIKENKKMLTLDLLSFNSDTLIAITSVCAVFISIVSMIFTFIFSMFQLKHNKNSVRPISAISFNDYEDDLAVKIKNVGTGPLTIKKLIFKDDAQESPDLISMMPTINQLWSTYTEPVDGWTIPVGGEIVLLRLYPENDRTKELIRRKLSGITAYLEYTDIYGTKFNDMRSLDFFGRHYM